MLSVLSPEKPVEQRRQILASNICSLCGLSAREDEKYSLKIGERSHQFCCLGCKQVYQIFYSKDDQLAENIQETQFYKICEESGIIPAQEDKDNLQIFDTSEPSEKNNFSSEEKELSIETDFKVDGMWCSACAWVIREILLRTQGILSAEVDFFSDRVSVIYLPHQIEPKEISATINRLGYETRPTQEDSKKEDQNSLLRFGVAAILSANSMMISLALYGGFFEDLGNQAVMVLSIVLLVIATPVVFYSGYPILKRAWNGLRVGAVSMDTLVSVGFLTAYLYSVYQLLSGSLHLYFDTATMLVTLVLFGKFIEKRALNKVTGQVNDLRQLANQKVRLFKNDIEKWVPSSDLKSGDIFLVKSGETVPVDGLVVKGHADIDESIITGESQPVPKQINTEILAGSKLIDEELHVAATAVGQKSSIGQMVELIEQALSTKNPVEQLSDRISRRFVPLIFATAALTVFSLWFLGTELETALLRGVTILVIACPCAFGIAAPLAKIAIVGRAHSKGIIIRNTAAFERLKEVDTVVFDKTGTVTEGAYTLRQIYSPNYDESEILQMAAAVEQQSEHFLARELRRQEKRRNIQMKQGENIQVFEGLGVSGNVNGRDISVGSRRFMISKQIDFVGDKIAERSRGAEQHGLTVIFIAWNEAVRAFMTFGDVLKEESSQLIKQLRKRGLNLWMASGDAKGSTEKAASQLGIEQIVCEVKPEEKAGHIRNIQAQGKRVAMIGDGVNDAIALAQADVGIVVGSNPGNLMSQAADITLLGRSINKVSDMFELSALLLKVTRQNFILAFVYNCIGLPLAIMGLLNPLIAVCAMFLSSLAVIGNTLRVARATGRAASESSQNKQSISMGLTETLGSAS